MMTFLGVVRHRASFLGQRGFDHIWFAMAAVLLGISALLAFLTFKTASSHFEALKKNQSTITKTVFSVYAAALDFETAERGFLLSSQNRPLQPYEEGATHLVTVCRELREALAEGPQAGESAD